MCSPKQLIGWFSPGTQRFCYKDEKDCFTSEAGKKRMATYSVPVFAEPDCACTKLNTVLELLGEIAEELAYVLEVMDDEPIKETVKEIKEKAERGGKESK